MEAACPHEPWRHRGRSRPWWSPARRRRWSARSHTSSLSSLERFTRPLGLLSSGSGRIHVLSNRAMHDVRRRRALGDGFGWEDCDNGDVFEGIYKQAASAAPARGEVAPTSNDEQWTLSGDEEEKDPFAAAVLGEGIEGIQSEGAGLDDLDAGEDPEDELKRQQNKAREKELMEILKGLMGGDCDWGNAQVGAGAQRLVSACRSESHDLELQIKEYQEKIDSCKEKIDKAKVETIAEDELNALQSKMQEKLQEEKQLREELRVVNDELDDLDRQRVSIKERTDAVKKKKKDTQKANVVHDT